MNQQFSKSEPTSGISTETALSAMFHHTWPTVSQRALDLEDVEQAWKSFIKVNYLMLYAALAREGNLKKNQVLFDIRELERHIEHTDDDNLSQEIRDAVLVDAPDGDVPHPTDGEMDDILDDLIRQAWAMCSLVVSYGNKYGVPLTQGVIDLRIGDVKRIYEEASPELRDKFGKRFRRVLARAEHAKSILRGEAEYEDYESIVSINYKDLITHRTHVGSIAWEWWVDVCQFIAGQRPGQPNYDPKRDEELKVFALLAPDAYGEHPLVCEPFDVTKDPKSPLEIPGHDIQAELQRIRSVVSGNADDWYTKFQKLGWCEMPDNETIDGYIRELN